MLQPHPAEAANKWPHGTESDGTQAGTPQLGFFTEAIGSREMNDVIKHLSRPV
jgi:hypothetical protein